MDKSIMDDVEITYPPELLPIPDPDDLVEIYVQEILPGDGIIKNKLIWSSENGYCECPQKMKLLNSQ